MLGCRYLRLGLWCFVDSSPAPSLEIIEWSHTKSDMRPVSQDVWKVQKEDVKEEYEVREDIMKVS